MKPYLEAGEFVTTHGVAGELRLYPYADSPDFFTSFHTFYLQADGGGPLRAESVRPHKNICLVKLEGVDSIADARPLIGKHIYISREDVDLPEGRFFVQDMIGVRIVDGRTGEEYGTIKMVTRPGSHDVYEVLRPDGSVSLFPAAEPFIDSMDIEGGVIKVLPIEGMFEDGPEPEDRSENGKKTSRKKEGPADDTD